MGALYYEVPKMYAICFFKGIIACKEEAEVIFV
jgi:hypothetical protein